MAETHLIALTQWTDARQAYQMSYIKIHLPGFSAVIFAKSAYSLAAHGLSFAGTAKILFFVRNCLSLTEHIYSIKI
jgi:hypothetical protein